MNEDREARHRFRMEKRKALQDVRVAAATGEKGLLMVHTGNGKGKSTAAFGLMLRMMGHGRRVGLVQFVKGAWETGEIAALARFDDLLVRRIVGEGFTWETQSLSRDVAAAEAGWAIATDLLADPSLSLVVLDELNIVLRHRYLDPEPVVAILAARRPDLHVLVTGRHAPPALVAAADLVTEMNLVRHPFAAGVKAQQGIEF